MCNLLNKSLIRHWVIMLNGISDICEYLDEPEKEVIGKIQKNQELLVKSWQEHTGTVEDYYRDNKQYLYDLVDFNGAVPYFKYRLAPLKEIAGLKILDIGCGIGTAAFMLADQGNDVTGYDINKQLTGFCEYKKRKYQLGGQFTDAMPDISQFDLIIAIDVLEHIEGLGAFLKGIGTKAKSESIFYHYDNFETNPLSPMHFDRSSEINRFLEEAGYKINYPFWATKQKEMTLCHSN